MTILYRFWEIVSYSSKVADFTYPTCIWRFHWGRIWRLFGVRKLESLPYRMSLSALSYVQPFLSRDVMHPRYMLWSCVCVCLCLCLSVTSRSSTKTAKRRITQTTPHDSPGTLVFWRQRSSRNSTGVTPYGGTKCRWGGSKSATFDK